jgi:hypothetical protein
MRVTTKLTFFTVLLLQQDMSASRLLLRAVWEEEGMSDVSLFYVQISTRRVRLLDLRSVREFSRPSTSKGYIHDRSASSTDFSPFLFIFLLPL